MIDKAALVEEYKAKNDLLLGEMQQYKQSKEQLEEYKGLLADSQAKNAQLSDAIKGHEGTISNLTEEINLLKVKHQENLDNANNRHKEEIERLNDRAKINEEKLELQIRKEYEEQIYKLRQGFNDKVEALHEEIHKLQQDLLNLKQNRGQKKKDETNNQG
jgi:chromosome segregation ATPase